MNTITDILGLRAATQPDRVVYSFLQDGEISRSLTYRELDRKSRTIAAKLRGSAANGPVLLLYPSGLDFIAAFFGCLYAGLPPIPLFPPRRNRPDPRIAAIIADSQARLGLTTADILADLGRRSEQQPEISRLLWTATDGLADEGDAVEPPAADSDAVAYLQYTSGSTSSPKGVMVKHGGLVHTLADLDRRCRHDADSAIVSWLPFFHDMGLVYGVLQALYNGFPCYLMNPAAFLQRPVRWLEAISRYGGTHSAAPNFAFDLCARSITEAEKAQLDLRRWQCVLNGAEPVREETMQGFATAFAACGFRREVFCPGYGLAEYTLQAALTLRDAGFRVFRASAEALVRGQVQEAVPGAGDSRTLVSSGPGEPGARIAIVDPDTCNECAAGRTGEIWLAGESVGLGYWGRPRETAETFGARLAGSGEGPFLRTGDFGFLWEGELYVTGRIKDMLILRGANYYPQDIEYTAAASHPSLKPGGGAAFAVECDGEERLVVLQELERTHMRGGDLQEVIKAIRAAVGREHELPVHAVVLLRPSSVPKTSSGKIQRHACRQAFLSGELDSVAEWRESRPTEGSVRAAEPRRSQGEAHASLERWIVMQLAERLGVPAGEIDAQESFASLGLDSLGAVRLSAALEERFGLKLSPTVAYEYPTPEALSRFLAYGAQAEEQAPSGRTAGDMTRQPLAIVGLACRFPGAADPQAFWDNLRCGREHVPAPAGRWAARESGDAGTLRPGHFLDAIDGFDAEFFGLSPREARSMDPQQRLLLEVAWEALEDAGLAAPAGSATGVFVGISSSDYSRLLFGGSAPPDAYGGTGGALSIAANRLSYQFDLRGPSWAVDTACSSSLVALHNACQALRCGECDLALAGGVNLIAAPELTASLAEAHMLSDDGRCRTFDAAANGYGRGEGCGLVVLKRYADALREGDRVLAVVMGSAVNQDGRSNGLTAPNAAAQRAVIRRALEQAGVTPSAIGYVETHGTGTVLGDPIEVEALTTVLGVDRPAARTCWLGSVKTNIGHLEAAAGIAGFIKTVLALGHGEIPPHLHLQHLNPHIRLDGTAFAVPTALQTWPRAADPRTAGVSSFGFGGTNAHVVVREADPPPPVSEDEGAGAVVPGPQLLALSAKDPAALRQLAGRYLARLDAEPRVALADLCFSANTGRRHLPHRAVLIADSPHDLRERLAALAAGRIQSCVYVGEAAVRHPPVVFLFTGQTSQYPGMGQDLYDTEPRFRQTLEECDRLLRPRLAVPLLEVLYGGPPAGALLEQTAYAQPALFALEYALAQLWRSWGIVPAALLGHSLGEYVAACVAGVFDLADGLRLVSERGRLMQALPERGEMAAVFAPAAQVAELIAPLSGTIDIAALNGPHNTVISGTPEAIGAAFTQCAQAGISARKLHSSQAFHSALMEPMLAQFGQVAASVRYHPPALPLVSNLTGGLATADIATPQYWIRHLRQPVRFAEGVASVAGQDQRLFLEIGPHPVLVVQGRECLAEAPDSAWLFSLRRNHADRMQMLGALAELHVRGAPVDWRGFHGGRGQRRVSLPTYPFQRRSYWLESSELPPRPSPSEPTAATWDDPETAGAALGLHLRAVAPAERLSILSAHIRSEVADILGFASGQGPDPRRGFFDMGMDSLMALELRNRLATALGQGLPPTLAFDFPSIESLAARLAELPVPVAPDGGEDQALAEIMALSEDELIGLVDRELQQVLP